MSDPGPREVFCWGVILGLFFGGCVLLILYATHNLDAAVLEVFW